VAVPFVTVDPAVAERAIVYEPTGVPDTVGCSTRTIRLPQAARSIMAHTRLVYSGEGSDNVI